MVTLKMLAQACGVSVGTVSKALHNAPDVNADTARRIRETAARMGYIPCAAARNLKTSRSHCLGVILNDGTASGLTHEFFANMLEGFKRRSEELGYDILLISDRPGPWGSEYSTHARYRNCDGVAVLVADHGTEAVNQMVESGIPVVSVDYVFDNCSVIKSDNLQGIRELVTYIYDQGHRRVAAIFGEDMPVTRVRVAGFYRTCAELGLSVPDEYVIRARYHDTASTAEATRRLLDLPRRPTCILYPDDYAIMGGLEVLEEQGLAVPQDMSITGFDGALLARVIRPRLTTVQQSTRALGETAAAELVRAVTEGRGFIPTEITIPCTLLKGETVRRIAPPAAIRGKKTG